jgi:hypothetical protein
MENEEIYLNNTFSMGMGGGGVRIDKEHIL